jgi:hypothetical protein
VPIHHARQSVRSPKALLFLINYARQQRINIWGKARVVEDDADLITRLMPPGYTARAGQAILFTVSAWDANCQQHIPRRFEVADVAAMLAERDGRIEALEAELKRLRGSAPALAVDTGRPGEIACSRFAIAWHAAKAAPDGWTAATLSLSRITRTRRRWESTNPTDFSPVLG